METAVRNNTEQSRYELMVEDAVAGVVEYREDGDQVELTHTEVDPSYEGEGIGSHLAHAVLDNLRNEERSLIPSCRFINGYLKRHPEFAELVPAERRGEFGL